MLRRERVSGSRNGRGGESEKCMLGGGAQRRQQQQLGVCAEEAAAAAWGVASTCIREMGSFSAKWVNTAFARPVRAGRHNDGGVAAAAMGWPTRHAHICRAQGVCALLC